MSLKIEPLRWEDLEAVQAFTDAEIGKGYYSRKELEEIFQKSSSQEVMCSFVLKNPEQKIKGVRITYPAGKWEKGKGSGLTVQAWPYPLENTAYFQSLFLSADLQGEGWGGKLSRHSLETLKKLNTKGVVCHSWKESPNDSSTRYLKKLGFNVVKEHLHYWKDVDYNCTRCLKPPCLCTAQEMYLEIDQL
ncbi:MAG: GNAT family N-acetyltransferase [Bdellovibrionales bacterium]